MPTMLAPSSSHTYAHATLTRESITWRTLDGGLVEISIDIANDDFEPTAADTLVIEAAPFGAFVPNVPLTRIAVGSLDPGERRTVSTVVPRSFLDAAIGNPARQGGNAGSFMEAFTALMDHAGHPHWIGNLNVYFDSRPEEAVERHCAFGLKVPAGSRVAAMFVMMDADDCTFETRCSDAKWNAGILSPGRMALMAVQTPTQAGEHAHVTVECTRTSDGRTVPVEFEFETVDGWGEALGCVQV